MANADSDASALANDLPSIVPSSRLIPDNSLSSTLLDAISDPIFVLTTKGDIRYANRRACNLLGYTEKEFDSMHIDELLPEATGISGRKTLRKVMRQGSVRLEVPLLSKQGKMILSAFECSLLEHEGKNLICAVASDISNQKRREEQFRHLVEEVEEYAIFMLDPEGRVITWNEGAEMIKGYAKDEILGKHFSTFYLEEDIEAGKPEKALEIATREGQWMDESWRMRKDGSRFWGQVTITALHDEEEQLRGYAKVTRDMTERRQREEALRESEQKYRRLFEESRDAVLLTTPEGKVVNANSASEHLFGYSREALLNMDVSKLYAKPKERLRRILPALKEATSTRVLEAWMRHNDGHTFLASASVTVHRNEEGEPELLQALVRDITERRRLQQDVLRMQEEERRRIGQDLHDGVASQLSGITLMLSTVAEMMDEDEPVLELIRKAEGLIQESSEDMRRLSRGLTPMPLSEAGLSVALARLAEHTEVCRFEEGKHLPALSKEQETHLYWIAQEAVTNARKYAEASNITIRLSYDDDELVLVVEDDGNGFDLSEVQESGLGQRTMKYRTELLGGNFRIDTNRGQGTHVECRLFAPIE